MLAVGALWRSSIVFKVQLLLHVLSSLTFRNSTYWQESVFMRIVWFWEQTATIALYSINLLVFIIETNWVYCAVRAESLSVIHVNLGRKWSCLRSIELYGALFCIRLGSPLWPRHKLRNVERLDKPAWDNKMFNFAFTATWKVQYYFNNNNNNNHNIY